MLATMASGEIRGPDLAGVVADANAAGLEHVVIGGFAVIAHGYFRATKDSRKRRIASSVSTPSGTRMSERIDATRFSDAIATFGSPLCAAFVGFKRLAGRGQDRVDLEKLEVANGELPVDPIPGLDG